MAELVSAYPTAGGIYWWAAKLGGPAWGWFTGWFNLVGLVGVVASVDYGAATFLNATLGLYDVDVFGMNFADGAHILRETFILFVVDPDDPRADQHLQLAARRAVQQHLGLLARDRRRGDRRRS